MKRVITDAPAALPQGFVVRPLTVEDLPAVLSIQKECYGEHYLEPRSAWAQRLSFSQRHILGVCRDNEVVAYAAAYTSQRGGVTPLNGFFTPVVSPDSMYLHDVAVASSAKGCALGSVLTQRLWGQAAMEGICFSSLVSVQSSRAYWERLGYRVTPLQNLQAQLNLSGYGSDAVYMEASIAQVSR
jgi:ribosomal protein S18 acetylase RimI-like enzyme